MMSMCPKVDNLQMNYVSVPFKMKWKNKYILLDEKTWKPPLLIFLQWKLIWERQTMDFSTYRTKRSSDIAWASQLGPQEPNLCNVAFECLIWRQNLIVVLHIIPTLIEVFRFSFCMVWNTNFSICENRFSLHWLAKNL